jgi:hypothetical protein
MQHGPSQRAQLCGTRLVKCVAGTGLFCALTQYSAGTEGLRRARASAATTDCAAMKGAVSSRGGPMLFEFTEPERNTMRRALELYVSELSGEIVKTEKREWLQALREEKTILKGVIEQLSV